MIKVYSKVYQVIQSVTEFYYKVCLSVITKCDRGLLQSASGITKCDSYYKVRRSTTTYSLTKLAWWM